MKVINIKDLCIPAQDASYDELSDFADRIAELATYPIEAEPVRRGKWEVVDYEEPRRYGCSACKRLVWHTENYCPNCGAKMEV